VVWSAVAGYNYPRIVIANRRHCFSNPAPRKTALTEGQHTWLSGPTGPLPPSANLHACMRARLTDIAMAPDGICLRAVALTRPEVLLGRNVLFSSELRGFAASREPVTSARPVPCSNASACQASQPAQTTAPQGPECPGPQAAPKAAAGTRAAQSVTLRLPGVA
jgi:hypothetical protein